MRRSLLLVLLFAACGGAQKDDGNTTVTVEAYDGPESSGPSIDESKAKVERLGALFAALGDSVDAAGSSCDQVAANITTWTTTNKAEVKKLNAELAAMPRAHVDELAPSLEIVLRKAALQLKDGSDRCPDHDGVFRAKSSLNF